jgi:hypothetical protein
MLKALQHGRNRLAEYYKNTEQSHGCLYAMGMVLAPSYKLEFFKGEHWIGDDADWDNEYEVSLHKYP